MEIQEPKSPNDEEMHSYSFAIELNDPQSVF